MNFNDALNEVLKQRKYDVLTGRAVDFSKTLDELITNIFRFILEHLNIPDLAMDNNNFSILPSFFMILGIVAAIALIGFVISRINKRRKRVLDIDEIINDLKENKITVESLMNHGKTLADAGNFREAVRYGFVALLWIMSLKEIISLDKAKTNNQFKSETNRNAPELYTDFSGIVEIFNYTWFGHKELSPENFFEYDSKINSLIKEVNHFGKDLHS